MKAVSLLILFVLPTFAKELRSFCQDKSNACNKDLTVCTDTKHLDWARENCRETCGFCFETTKSATKATTPQPSTTPRVYIPGPLETIRQNGQWTYWDAWSDCTVSCGGGTRTRRRYCVNPPPQNGGDDCVGQDRQNQPCNDFNCADCFRACPWGGNLSPDCSLCKCDNSYLSGTVVDGSNHPIEGVHVYINSRQWDPIATSDAWGQYRASGVCLLGEDLVFMKERFREHREQAYMINDTHWQCSATMQPLVPPQMQIQPKDKVRFEGQSVKICCRADGSPEPTRYTWIKDGKEIQGGEDGELQLGNMKVGDSGLYSCRVETVAGIVMSRKSKLSVHPKSSDVCVKTPSDKWINLPSGCHVTLNGIQETTINIGECKREMCATTERHNVQNCIDEWPRQCCDVNQTEPVDVTCPSFTYGINRVVSCKCQECVTLTQISGTAYGVQNGVKVPFRHGEIYIRGKQIGATSAAGYFSVSINHDTTSVVLEFKNDKEGKFMDTMKSVEIVEDQNTPINLVIPLKPTPIRFNTNFGLTTPLGSASGKAAVSYMSFPKDSIVNKNGVPYRGRASISINFIDPRDITSLEAAYGSISTIDDDGEERPINTYGMLNYVMEDDTGNPLFINSPLSFTMDPVLFNVTVQPDGSTDIYTWYLDMETGKWVKYNRFVSKQNINNGRRRLLQSSSQISSTLPSVPRISWTETITRLSSKQRTVYYKRHYTYYVTVPVNVDKPSQTTRTVSRTGTKTASYNSQVYLTTKETRTRRDACVVRVQAYDDMSFKTSLNGVTITAYSYDKVAQKYSGMDKQPVDSQGRACLKIFCNHKVTLSAEQAIDPVELVASPTHSLFPGYQFNNTYSKKRVEFESLDWGFDPQDKKYSPVLKYEKLGYCKSTTNNDYHFQFAPLYKPPLFSPTVGKDITSNRLSWYPVAKDKPTRRSCFIKVKLVTKSSMTTDVRMIAISYQNNTSSPSARYGTVEASPIPDLTKFSNTVTEKAACLEFRCPGTVHDGKKTIQDVPTLVDVQMNNNSTCSKFKLNSNLRRDVEHRFSFGNRFKFHARPKFNYGPLYGVYISNGPTDTTRNFCFSGRDTGNISNTMTTDSAGVAVTFDCT